MSDSTYEEIIVTDIVQKSLDLYITVPITEYIVFEIAFFRVEGILEVGKVLLLG